MYQTLITFMCAKHSHTGRWNKWSPNVKSFSTSMVHSWQWTDLSTSWTMMKTTPPHNQILLLSRTLNIIKLTNDFFILIESDFKTIEEFKSVTISRREMNTSQTPRLKWQSQTYIRFSQNQLLKKLIHPQPEISGQSQTHYFWSNNTT